MATGTRPRWVAVTELTLVLVLATAAGAGAFAIVTDPRYPQEYAGDLTIRAATQVQLEDGLWGPEWRESTSDTMSERIYTAVFDADDHCVALIESMSGMVISMSISPPGRRVTWVYSRSMFNNFFAGHQIGDWTLGVIDSGEHDLPSGYWGTFKTYMNWCVDADADGVPELKRVKNGRGTMERADRFTLVDDPWIPQDADTDGGD